MNNPHLGGDALEHLENIIPDTYETRFVGLLEMCDYALHEINQGRTDKAKEFLEKAINDAKKPWRSQP